MAVTPAERQVVDIDGPLHYLDFGGLPEAPVMVLVHGLGASAWSWSDLAGRLTDRYRVLAPDLVGFGRSEPAGRDSTVRANAAYLARFVTVVVGGPVTLVGNSMGGMISVLVTARRPQLVEGLVLVNPALPGRFSPQSLVSLNPRVALFFAAYHTPGVAERFLADRRRRLTPAEQIRLLLATVCSDPDRVDPDLVDQLVAQTAEQRAYAWADQAFLRAVRSIMAVLTVGRRRYVRMLNDLPLPTLLVHGSDDQLVHVSSAHRVAAANPRIRLEVLGGVGHAPQLEVPAELARLVTAWHDGTLSDAA